MKPVIHIYVLCWNEEKMIPFFLTHYDNIADKIFVYDNQSTDNSIKLLAKNPKVIIRSYKSEGQIRDDYYLTIKNHEWKQSRGVADIVIVCDMDEFIYSENIAASMLDFYQSKATIIRPEGYNMIIEKFSFRTKNKNITEQIKTGVQDAYFNKLCVFKPNEITEIRYLHGCHNASPSGNIIFYREPMKLLHYKYITIDYVLSRMKAYKIRLSAYNKKYRLGFQYENDNQEHIKYFNKLLSEAKILF